MSSVYVRNELSLEVTRAVFFLSWLMSVSVIVIAYAREDGGATFTMLPPVSWYDSAAEVAAVCKEIVVGLGATAVSENTTTSEYVLMFRVHDATVGLVESRV